MIPKRIIPDYDVSWQRGLAEHLGVGWLGWMTACGIPEETILEYGIKVVKQKYHGKWEVLGWQSHLAVADETLFLETLLRFSD